jgi:hypothetical protein
MFETFESREQLCGLIPRKHASDLRRRQQRHELGTEQVAFGKRSASVDAADGGLQASLD